MDEHLCSHHSEWKETARIVRPLYMGLMPISRKGCTISFLANDKNFNASNMSVGLSSGAISDIVQSQVRQLLRTGVLNLQAIFEYQSIFHPAPRHRDQRHLLFPLRACMISCKISSPDPWAQINPSSPVHRLVETTATLLCRSVVFCANRSYPSMPAPVEDVTRSGVQLHTTTAMAQ